MIRFVGDVHGNYRKYLSLIEGADRSIQVGDFGMGFLSRLDAQHMRDQLDPIAHRFIRGNHDDPTLCRSTPHWIEDASHDEEEDIFFLGGAWSIDADWRNIRVLLALPLKRAGSAEVDREETPHTSARYRTTATEVRDNNAGFDTSVPLEIGKRRLRLIPDRGDQREYATVGISRVSGFV